jgi:hypothetical protein
LNFLSLGLKPNEIKSKLNKLRRFDSNRIKSSNYACICEHAISVFQISVNYFMFRYTA